MTVAKKTPQKRVRKTTRPRKATQATVRLRYVRSAIGAHKKHKIIIKGLGFRKLNQVVERPDTAHIRGMVEKVQHLVEVVSS